jgi:hypothetical protein
MATNPTITNTALLPGGGWTLLATGPSTAFLRVSKLPKHAVVFLTVAASLPTPNSGGYRFCCESEHFDGAYTGNLYGRIQNNSNDEVIVSVWQL